MQDAQADFEAAGAGIVLVGQATPQDAAHFREHFEIELPVLADRRRESYRAVAASPGGIGAMIGPRVVIRGLNLILRRGLRQGRTIGHPTQLGAAVVIAPGGEVWFSQRARDASDNAPPQALLKAIGRQPART